MKKSFIILSTIFAAIFSSCTIDNLFEDDGVKSGSTTVSFSVDFGTDAPSPGTKALTETPTVENLYLAVFNADGKALVEYVKAEPVAATTNGTKYDYTATLKLSDSKRVIHFIANGPEELGYGSEEDAVGSLLYSFDTENWEGEDAYWGYVELPNGICDQNSSGYSALTTALSDVKLVRNFAKIQVAKADDSNFVLSAFWINNFPDRSSAAPYNRDARRFETAYVSGTPYQYATEAMTAGYKGFCPASSGLISLSGLDNTILEKAKCDADNNWTAYTYEREVPVADPLCIIVKGHMDTESQDSYYKIDLRDADGKYLPILRNFTYKVTIGVVEKVGEESIEDALSSVGNGSIDTNLELQGLTNMSNGTSKITVSKTSAVIYSNDDEILNYQYIPNLGADDDGDGMADMVNTTLDQLINDMGYLDEAAVQLKELSYVKITREFSSTGGAVFSSMEVDKNDKDGSRTVTFKPDDATNGIPRTEVVTITGYYYNTSKKEYETLSRTVNYQIRPRMQMELMIDPGQVTGESTRQPVKLTIGIEENLPSSLFTLDLTVVARNMTVTPAKTDLPISTTMINGMPTYCFTKAITWEQYNNAETYTDADGVIRKLFECEFLTNTTSFPEIDITNNPNLGDYFIVTNKYFEDAGIELYAGDDSKYWFTKLGFNREYLVPDRTVDYTFTMSALPTDGKIFISMGNMRPAPGSPLTLMSSETDIDYSGNTVYEMTVSNLTETISVTPEDGVHEAYIRPLDVAEFNKVRCTTIDVHPLQFNNLRIINLADEDKDYVVSGRPSRISFHMDEMPSENKITLKLNHLTRGTAMTGISNVEDKGSGEYVLTVNSLDVTLDVTPDTGDNLTASFTLSKGSEFEENSCSAEIKKLSFNNLHVLNVANPNYTHVIGGKPVRICFELEEMPTDAHEAITLSVTGLQDISTVVGTGNKGISSISGSNGVYQIVANSKNVIIEATATGGQNTASFMVENEEFYDGNCSAEIKKLSFNNAKIINVANQNLPHVIGGKPAQISFTLEDLPSSANGVITLNLTNLTIPDGAVMTNGSYTKISDTEYQLTATDRSITIDAVAVGGQDYASYTLTNTEFYDGGASGVEIKKLSFKNPKLINKAEPDLTYVIGGKPAQISFTLEDLPSSANGVIILNLTNLTIPDGAVMTNGSYTKLSDIKYELTPTGRNITLDVKPTAGQATASYTLTNTEFYDGGVSEVEIRKLSFSDLKFIVNTTPVDYLLTGDQTSKISFTMDQLPDDGDVTLYIKNAAPLGQTPPTDGQFHSYVINVTDNTTILDIEVSKVTGTNVAAEFYLGDDNNEFYTMNQSDYATKTIKTRYTIDWSKVLIKGKLKTTESAAKNAEVEVYTDPDFSGSPVYTIITDTNGKATGTGTVDSKTGTENYYFKFEDAIGEYRSSASKTLIELASNVDKEVVCNIRTDGSHTFYAGDFKVTLGGSSKFKGTVYWTTQSEYSDKITMGNNSGQNNSTATITCTSKELITFECNGYSGTFTINQVIGKTINLTK